MTKLGLVSSVMLLSALCGSCDNRTAQTSGNFSFQKLTKSARGNINLSIILDVTDRIAPKKGDMKDKDLEYINNILCAFTNHILNKRLIQIDDKITFYICPDKGLDNYVKKLNVELKGGAGSSLTLPYISDINIRSKTILEELYEQRIMTGEQNHWDDGGDIIRILRDYGSDLCVQDGYENKVIMITDGFSWEANSSTTDGGNKSNTLIPQNLKQFDHSGWENQYTDGDYGYIPLNENIDADFLILGLTKSPSGPYSYEILKHYWAELLKDKVKTYDLLRNDSPSTLKPVIEKFIWGE